MTIMEALGGHSGDTIMEVLGGHKGETIAQVIENTGLEPVTPEPAPVNPLNGMAVDFNIASDMDLFGKVVSDLQENMSITGGDISGTSHYVSEYTGFSGKVDEQSGNYIALHVSVPDMTIGQDGLTVKVNNSALDSDGVIVLILKSEHPTVSVVATKGDFSKTISLTTTGLTKEAAPGQE